MQRVSAARPRGILGGREGQPPDPAPTVPGLHEKLGEERVAAAIFEIISPGDDAVPGNLAVDFEDDDASESRVPGEPLEARPEEGAVEGDALPEVEVGHHLEDLREVGGRRGTGLEHAERYAPREAFVSTAIAAARAREPVPLLGELLVPGPEVERHAGVRRLRGPLVEAAAGEIGDLALAEFVREPPASDVAGDPRPCSDLEDVADGRSDEIGEERARR